MFDKLLKDELEAYCGTLTNKDLATKDLIGVLLSHFI